MNKSIVKKFSGKTLDNKPFCTGELECQINITKPHEMIYHKSKYEYFYYDNVVLSKSKEIDILDKIFLVYELHNDFDKNNIDILIDLISDTSFTLELNYEKIFNINLALSCFFSNDITYIDTNELNHQIVNGGCNLDNHIYKKLIEYIIQNNNTKFLIIPVDIGEFIKSLFIKNIPALILSYQYRMSNNKLLDFVKSISISEYGYIIPKEYNSINIIIDGIFLRSYKYTFNNTHDLAVFCPTILQYIVKKCKYFTIKVAPDYINIDKDLWSEAIYMLPNINSITFIKQNNIEQKLTQNEMVVRRTKNCHIYIFTLKNDEKCKITLNVDTPQIQISFNICLYMQNELIIVNGMACMKLLV